MPNELYRDFIEDQFDRVVNAINNELPTPVPADIGKVVQVVSDGGTGAEYALETPTSGATDLSQLDDVSITTPTAGQILKYNSVNQTWYNDDMSYMNYPAVIEVDKTLDATSFNIAVTSNGITLYTNNVTMDSIWGDFTTISDTFDVDGITNTISYYGDGVNSDTAQNWLHITLNGTTYDIGNTARNPSYPIDVDTNTTIKGAERELPVPTTSDIDKVVKVISDGSGGAEYSLDAVPNELPTPTISDIGKVATVVSDGSGGAEYSLNTPSSGLPTATGAGHLLGTDNNSNWIELIPTPTGHSVIPYYAGGSWKYKDITPEVTASYYGTLNLSFGALTRAEFVNTNITKVVAFNGMSADFTKNYTGTIPCYGYQNNKFAVFKGLVFSSGSSGRAEITINIDYSDSTKDSITITDL